MGMQQQQQHCCRSQPHSPHLQGKGEAHKHHRSKQGEHQPVGCAPIRRHDAPVGAVERQGDGGEQHAGG